ncbi:MAG TPA: ImmA/IrrE family metallo-endopeptidase [Anaerolineaceae bacterium]
MKPDKQSELSYQANELRKRFGEDLSSPIDVFAILQSQENLTLVFYPFSDRISGMCVRARSGEQLIAINSTRTLGRQRFTAAHELYHLYVQDDIITLPAAGGATVICGSEIGAGRDEEEKNADCFASYFLAPNDALRSFIEKNLLKGARRPIVVEDVVRIEQHFRMSRQATLYRLVGDGWITFDFANTLRHDIIVSARRLGFSNELYVPTPEDRQYFASGSYIGLAERLRGSDVISNGKYEELLLDAYRADIVYNLEPEGRETYD